MNREILFNLYDPKQLGMDSINQLGMA